MENLLLVLSALVLSNDAVKDGGVIALQSDQVLAETLILPSNTTLDGNGYTLTYTGTNSALLVEGSEGVETHLMAEAKAGGGLPALNPIIEVADSTAFQVGDKVKFVRGDRLVEFNTVVGLPTPTSLQLEERFAATFPAETRVVHVRPNENTTIKNLVIQGGEGNDAAGIHVFDAYLLKIQNVKFKNLTRDGIQISYSYAPKIENSQFIANGRPGQGDDAIGVSYSYAPVITGNSLLFSGALVLRNTQFGVIAENILDSSGRTGGDGISLVGATNSRIVGNTISRANCYGIWAKDNSHFNTITGNVFSSGITSAIYLTNHANYNIISENAAHKNNGNGIFLGWKARHNTISNNTTVSNGARGILVHEPQNNLNGNKSADNFLEDILHNQEGQP